MLLTARFIPYRAYSPYENMAADEFLISYYKKTRVPVLRVYSWSPPSISIGRFQDPAAINIDAATAARVPIVRRMTGGGGIFHCDEVTYCLVCSEADMGTSGVKPSFEKLNSFLIKTYAKMGLSAAFAKDTQKQANPRERVSFCFSGAEEYDIIINNSKIGGNAQKRVKEIIFQHGSIPLRRADKAADYFFDGAKGDYTSLEEQLKRPVEPAEVYANMAAAFTEALGFDLREEDFTMDEKREIVGLVTGKYARQTWNVGGRED